MMYRNLLALETEELIRSYPIDGVVLMGGCDKTVPGLVMGALSAGLPSMFLPAGPMLRGTWKGRPLGSGTDVWRYWADTSGGLLDDAAWTEIEDGIARSAGPLHDDGHSLDDDRGGRRARPHVAWCVVDRRRRRRSRADGRGMRPPHRGARARGTSGRARSSRRRHSRTPLSPCSPSADPRTRSSTVAMAPGRDSSCRSTGSTSCRAPLR